MLPTTHGLVRVQGVGEDTPNNMSFLSTLNHWTFTEHTSWPSKPQLPKFLPKRLMSLGYKPKMRWCISGFVVILCKYELLFKKPLAMSVKVIIWAVSFDSLCEPDPYVDVDNIMGYDPNWWKGNVDHESTSWSKDLTGYVSQIHVVEWNMSLFWALNRFTHKINNMLMWHELPMKYSAT